MRCNNNPANIMGLAGLANNFFKLFFGHAGIMFKLHREYPISSVVLPHRTDKSRTCAMVADLRKGLTVFEEFLERIERRVAQFNLHRIHLNRP